MSSHDSYLPNYGFEVVESLWFPRLTIFQVA